MGDRLRQMFSVGAVYYKLAIAECAVLLLIAWTGGYLAATEGMTDEKWKAMGDTGHRRHYVLLTVPVLTTLKGFLSQTVVKAKEKQDEDTAHFRKT